MGKREQIVDGGTDHLTLAEGSRDGQNKEADPQPEVRRGGQPLGRWGRGGGAPERAGWGTGGRVDVGF